MPDDPGAPLPPEPGGAPNQTDELEKLKQKVAELSRPSGAAPASFREFCYGFPSSGLFYILLGMLFLLVAQWRMESTHAAFTFVLVVLGIAVLLYGTGTQGAGSFNSDAAAAKYNVAIAGGAGILALCVAFGMVKFAPEMANAFHVEQRYMRVLIKSADGSSRIGQYTARFSTDGIPIPSVLRGNSYVEVFVPYTLSELASLRPADATDAGATAKSAKPSAPVQRLSVDLGCTPAREADAAMHAIDDDSADARKTISGEFYRIPATKDPLDPKFDRLRDTVSQTFVIKMSKYRLSQKSAGQDFPEYGEKVCINLQNDEQPRALQITTQAISNRNSFNIGSAPLATELPKLDVPAELVIR